MNKLLTLQSRWQQAADCTSDQQLKGCFRYEQAAFHTATVLDGSSHILIRQLAALAETIGRPCLTATAWLHMLNLHAGFDHCICLTTCA